MEIDSANVVETKENESADIGSERRKRNRVNGKNQQTTNEIISNEGEKWLHSGNFGIDTTLEEFEGMILQFFSKKEDYLRIYTEEKATALLRKISLEIIKVSIKSINAMDTINTLNEKIHELEERISALLLQNLQSQISNITESEGRPITYAEAIKKNATTIVKGNTLPQPQLPAELRHSPAEKIVIVKAEVKGETVGKETLEKFRKFIKDIIGDAATEVTAIRPTRHGGYIIVVRSESARNNIRDKIIKSGVIHENRVVAPPKKHARMICRETPHENQKEEVLNDLYRRHNSQLSQIPPSQRMANINITKFGWIFELSPSEASAIEAQGGKLRYGFGCELRLEEFIPIQQCFRCCHFGHNANDCAGKSDVCHLCAVKGHCGRDCPYKNDRSKWKCINCIEENQARGLNLNVFHAAAQMHKCSVAEHEKNIRRSQLAATGVL